MTCGFGCIRERIEGHGEPPSGRKKSVETDRERQAVVRFTAGSPLVRSMPKKMCVTHIYYLVAQREKASRFAFIHASSPQIKGAEGCETRLVNADCVSFQSLECRSADTRVGKGLAVLSVRTTC